VLHGYDTYTAKAVILAMGIDYRKLGVPGELELLGRGYRFALHVTVHFSETKW